MLIYLFGGDWKVVNIINFSSEMWKQKLSEGKIIERWITM